MTQGRRSISDYASALTAKTDPAHSLFSRRAVWAAAAAVLVFAALLFTLPDVTNNPRPLAEYGEKTLFTAFGGRSPRTLDPQRSYSSDETAYTYSIYEPPYQYAYLKRPYELEPRTVEKVAEPKYFDKSGKELPADADPEAVAESRYVLKIRRGIFYAPHPAFAKDEKGATTIWMRTWQPACAVLLICLKRAHESSRLQTTPTAFAVLQVLRW